MVRGRRYSLRDTSQISETLAHGTIRAQSATRHGNGRVLGVRRKVRTLDNLQAPRNRANNGNQVLFFAEILGIN